MLPPFPSFLPALALLILRRTVPERDDAAPSRDAGLFD